MHSDNARSLCHMNHRQIRLSLSMENRYCYLDLTRQMTKASLASTKKHSFCLKVLNRTTMRLYLVVTICWPEIERSTVKINEACLLSFIFQRHHKTGKWWERPLDLNTEK